MNVRRDPTFLFRSASSLPCSDMYPTPSWSMAASLGLECGGWRTKWDLASQWYFMRKGLRLQAGQVQCFLERDWSSREACSLHGQQKALIQPQAVCPPLQPTSLCYYWGSHLIRGLSLSLSLSVSLSLSFSLTHFLSPTLSLSLSLSLSHTHTLFRSLAISHANVHTHTHTHAHTPSGLWSAVWTLCVYTSIPTALSFSAHRFVVHCGTCMLCSTNSTKPTYKQQ